MNRLLSFSTAMLILAAACFPMNSGCVPKKSVEPAGGPGASVQQPPEPAPEPPIVETPVEEMAQEPPPSLDIEHQVQWAGETLSIIARWYTGDIHNWKALADANSHIDPNVLPMNARIIIPDALIKNRNPMPRDYLNQFYKKKTDDPGQVPEDPEQETETGTESEEIELFGPKTFQLE